MVFSKFDSHVKPNLSNQRNYLEKSSTTDGALMPAQIGIRDLKQTDEGPSEFTWP